MQFAVEEPGGEVWRTSPLMLEKAALREMLPEEDGLDWLAKRVRCDGKRICPTAIAWHPDLPALLHMEADLDTWHVPPFSGPTSEWPAEIVELLRHIRQTRGLLQMRAMSKPEDKQ